MNSPHKGPVTRKMFPFDDVIIICHAYSVYRNDHGIVRLVAVMLPTSMDWNGEILFYKDIHIRITDLSTHWLFVWLLHNIKSKFMILATTKAVQQPLVFRVTGHLCGEFTGPGEFPAQRPVTQSFDVFFDQARLNKRLSKQSWGWWLETQSHPLCRQCNVNGTNEFKLCLLLKRILEPEQFISYYAIIPIEIITLVTNDNFHHVVCIQRLPDQCI